MQIEFKSCHEEIAGALQEFCNRWCKREDVESHALNSWKLNIFKIIDGRILFYCNSLDFLPPKPKFTFKHWMKGIQEFHRRFVLAPGDKADKLEFILRLKIKHNDWLLADTCPQAANHCALF